MLNSQNYRDALVSLNEGLDRGQYASNPSGRIEDLERLFAALAFPSEEEIRHIEQLAETLLSGRFRRFRLYPAWQDTSEHGGADAPADLTQHPTEADDPQGAQSEAGDEDAPAVEGAVQAMLRDPDVRVRADAARQLGTLRAASATEALVQTLWLESHPRVRKAAAESLARIEGEHAEEALERAAEEDPAAEVREAAAAARNKRLETAPPDMIGRELAARGEPWWTHPQIREDFHAFLCAWYAAARFEQEEEEVTRDDSSPNPLPPLTE